MSCGISAVLALENIENRKCEKLVEIPHESLSLTCNACGSRWKTCDIFLYLKKNHVNNKVSSLIGFLMQHI